MLAKDGAIIDYLDTKNPPPPSPSLINVKDFSRLLDLPLKSLEAIDPASFSLIVGTSSGPLSTS